MRSADADVGRYLKLFTFMPMSDITTLIAEHELQPSKRIAQRKLAREVLEIVHGKVEANEAETQHSLLFRPSAISNPSEAKNSPESNTEVEGDDKTSNSTVTKPADVSSALNKKAPHTTAANAPSLNVILPKSLIYRQPIARVLYSAGLVASKSEGHRLVAKKGAYIGSRPSASGTMGDNLDFSPCANWNPNETEKYIIGDDMLILRVGKWKLKIVMIISDEEFEERGLTAPGWKEDDKKPNPHEDQASKQWHSERYIEKAPLHQGTAKFTP